MAGKIIADTIETGAGADISTSYVVNGSAKAWVNFNGTGTVVIRGSVNVSSLTDNGTGDYTVNVNSAFADVNFTLATAQGSASAGLHRDRMFNENADSRTVSSARMISNSSQTTANAYAEDNEYLYASVHGDLA